MGDWNTRPETLAESLFPKGTKSIAVVPDAPFTRSQGDDSLYGFVVAAEDIASEVTVSLGLSSP